MTLSITAKFKKSDLSPDSPQGDLLNVAFHVFSSREEQQKQGNLEKAKFKCQLLTVALGAQNKIGQRLI